MEHQVQNWDDNGRKFEAGLYRDTITFFRKPGVLAASMKKVTVAYCTQC